MNAARHVVFVCPRFADGATLGGAETLLRAQAERVARAGWRVTFLTTCARNHVTWRNEASPGRERIAGMTVVRFPVDEKRDVAAFLRMQDRLSRFLRLSAGEERMWLANGINSTALCEYLRREGGAAHCIVVGPYLFALTDAVSRVFPEKTLLLPCLHDEPFARLACVRALFERVAGVLFNSRPEQELAKRLFDIRPNASWVVGMGLEEFAAEPGRFRKRTGVKGPFVMYSGRREPLKGTPLLVNYLDLFVRRTGREIRLVLTGSGAVTVPPTLATRVVDLGFVSEETKHDAMAAATVFAHPSWNESFGIVLLESWLARTPALVHAGSDVLRHHCRVSGGGLWFSCYPEFEAELELLLGNEPLRRAMGAAGRRYVQSEYAWEKVEERLFAALGSPPKSAGPPA